MRNNLFKYYFFYKRRIHKSKVTMFYSSTEEISTSKSNSKKTTKLRGSFECSERCDLKLARLLYMSQRCQKEGFSWAQSHSLRYLPTKLDTFLESARMSSSHLIDSMAMNISHLENIRIKHETDKIEVFIHIYFNLTN